ncbi:hypothetical protein QFC22_000719 [Naganishia vaughanmartiniae]|uniref:Uncharacterized protein n=1 Tax=Naganishia vaughanmartiniae TaxID=1424756 RepID=A0ACC2XJA9_9TREE|nr:hypothetical protein QFC22_000719 [Naganishia vaughanmartiniae]
MPPPPPPPAASSSAFAEAGANAAAAASAGRQHHVYLHGMDHFGRARAYRRGPSRLKWFLLGGLAAFVFLKHRRNQQLRYGEEDDWDPRRYFFACRRRVEDSTRPVASTPPVIQDTVHPASPPVDRMQRKEGEQREWHGRWQRHHSAEKSSAPVNNHSDTVSEIAPMTGSDGKSNIKPNANPTELLTFDNTSFDRQRTSATPTSRERMETEAMAFAEEKIDALVTMLEGLKAKLNAKKE